MSGSLYFPVNKATDANDDPASGAKATFFDTGTTTPQTVYSDASLTTPHPVPLVANSSGVFATIFTAGATQVKVIVTDSDDVTLPGYPLDPAVFQASSASASTVAFTPTARISSTNVQAAIEEVDGFVEAIEDSRTIEHTIENTGGTGTAYTATITGVTAYAATDVYLLKIGLTNTGAVTLNINTIGTRDVKKYDGTNALVPLIAGDWRLGQIHRILDDGTQFIVITPMQASTTEAGLSETSTSAENIAGTATDASPTVAGTKEMIDTHGAPSVFPVRINFDGTGTVAINSSTGVSSLVDDGTGLYTINFTANQPDTDYGLLVLAGTISGGDVRTFFNFTSKLVGSCTVRCVDVNNTGVDRDDITVVVVQ